MERIKTFLETLMGFLGLAIFLGVAFVACGAVAIYRGCRGLFRFII